MTSPTHVCHHGERQNERKDFGRCHHCYDLLVDQICLLFEARKTGTCVKTATRVIAKTFPSVIEAGICNIHSMEEYPISDIRSKQN